MCVYVLIYSHVRLIRRCLFYNMHLAPQQQNFTLMPVIDMANHTNDPATTFKIEVTTHGGLEFRAPPGAEAKKDGDHWRGLRRGDPVCLNYGPHSNSVRCHGQHVLPVLPSVQTCQRTRH